MGNLPTSRAPSGTGSTCATRTQSALLRCPAILRCSLRTPTASCSGINSGAEEGDNAALADSHRGQRQCQGQRQRQGGESNPPPFLDGPLDELRDLFLILLFCQRLDAIPSSSQQSRGGG